MLGDLWRRLRARREEAAVARRAIPDDLWKRTLVRYPFLQRSDPTTAAELRRLTSLFLDSKEFTTAGDLRLTDMMAVSIAAQAALPVLRLGLAPYDSFVGIVIQPDAVRVPRSHVDDDGVVHEYEDTLAGEAMPGGPLMLSWPDVRAAGRASGQAYNVVIHEFAHVLDASGLVPEGLTAREWTAEVEQACAEFTERVDRGEDTVLDPYAANGPEEFFAVASESFFVDPTGLRQAHPAFHALLLRYYRQDPERERPPARKAAAGGAGTS